MVYQYQITGRATRKWLSNDRAFKWKVREDAAAYVRNLRPTSAQVECDIRQADGLLLETVLVMVPVRVKES